MRQQGNSSNSFIDNYLLAFAKATIIMNGKLADLTYVYNNEPIVCIDSDLSRVQSKKMDHLYSSWKISKVADYLAPNMKPTMYWALNEGAH